MDTTIKLKCKNCGEEIYVKPYISKVKITALTNLLEISDRYQASMKASAICYHCGLTVEEYFTEDIYTEDIEKLILSKLK